VKIAALHKLTINKDVKMNHRISHTQIFSALLIWASAMPAVHAVELRYGSGDFTMGMDVPFVSMDTTLSVDTVTLAEPHKNLGNSPVYYQFRTDYFDSDTVNKMTDLASLPLRTKLPLVNSSVTDLIADNTALPVPADYRMHGLNVDVGVGYDVIKTPKGHVGVGVNTGVSTPFMEVRNVKLGTANFALDILDTFDTDITTYKAGVGVQGSYQATPWLDVSGGASLNHQTGEMDNGIVGAGIDMDGTYRTLEIAAKIKPAVLLKHPQLKNAFIAIGHSQSQWDYDSATVSTPVGNVKIPGVMDANAEHSSSYIGVGYDF
jgi:hypothetical protein